MIVGNDRRRKGLSEESRARLAEGLSQMGKDASSAGPSSPLRAGSPLERADLLAIRIALIAELNQQAALEEELGEGCWFSYRGVAPFQRTLIFADAYERVLRSFAGDNAELAPGTDPELWRPLGRFAYATRSKGAGRGYRPARLWPSLVRGRRLCDRHRLPYDLYCRGAVATAKARGWKFALRPSGAVIGGNLWRPRNGPPGSSVLAFVLDHLEDGMLLCREAYFRAEGWKGEPLQREYLAWVARRIVDMKGGNEREIARAWGLYQRDGVIPSSLTYEELLS